MSNWIWRADAEAPSFAVAWKDRDGNLIDFSSGYTFEIEFVRNDEVVWSKTTGITGAATSPNVVVAWASGDLANLTSGVSYELHLTATDSSSNDRHFKPGRWPKAYIETVPTS